jgi:hypothetical protein
MQPESIIEGGSSSPLLFMDIIAKLAGGSYNSKSRKEISESRLIISVVYSNAHYRLDTIVIPAGIMLLNVTEKSEQEYKHA